MDGLKRSLEHAIKELQEAPAPARPNPQPPAQNKMPARQVNARQSPPPAANSIESALASAPSVSPHYVPPAPPPKAAPPIPKTPARSRVLPSKPVAPKPARGTGLVLTKPSQPARKEMPTPKNIALSIKGFGNGADQVDIGAVEQKKLRDNNIWRWATICISCAGGLASGWLGSTVSEPSNGIFTANVQTIVGKASQSLENGRHLAAVKVVPSGLSDRGAPDKPGDMVGKTDRSFATDENLCTVLELDRGTGLTLAKPCKPVKTADFDSTFGKSTLGKADLFETPQ